MDGPGHYRAAEEAFEKARRATESSPRDVVDRYLTAAQFHATMALVGAVIETVPAPGVSLAWGRVLVPRANQTPTGGQTKMRTASHPPQGPHPRPGTPPGPYDPPSNPTPQTPNPPRR